MSNNIGGGDHTKHEEEDEEAIRLKAQAITNGALLPMALKTAIELDILEAIAEASVRGAYLSAHEIARKIPGCVNPDAPACLDSMLCLLASFSILKCETRNSDAGVLERAYGVAPLSKYFLKNQVQNSMATSHLLSFDKVTIDFWYHMNDAILEGGIPFNKAHGMSVFEYMAKDLRFGKLFNSTMSKNSTVIIEKILEVYQGFEGVNVLVDVGGGIGTNLNFITSKYPNIKGINFDLPHVVTNAVVKNPGVEYVGGSMFDQVPNGDAIVLKWILHNWKDTDCLKILKNCWKALPTDGKVIVVERLLPLSPEDSLESQNVFSVNLTMFTVNGTLERNIEEYKSLAFHAGFSGCRVMCEVNGQYVIEFQKAKSD